MVPVIKSRLNRLAQLRYLPKPRLEAPPVPEVGQALQVRLQGRQARRTRPTRRLRRASTHMTYRRDGQALKVFRAVCPVSKIMVTRVYSRATAGRTPQLRARTLPDRFGRGAAVPGAVHPTRRLRRASRRQRVHGRVGACPRGTRHSTPRAAALKAPMERLRSMPTSRSAQQFAQRGSSSGTSTTVPSTSSRCRDTLPATSSSTTTNDLMHRWHARRPTSTLWHWRLPGPLCQR